VTRSEDGHPGLWWPGGDVADEAPGVREAYDETLAGAPRRRTTIPSKRQILARGRRGGRRG
jgi:hypothetical protein